MLIQSKSLNNEVVTVKMISGEEIISRVQEDNDDHFILNKPLCLIPGPNGGLGLAPALFSTDPKDFVRVNKTAIALQAKTAQDIANQYLQQTTGLTIAKAV
jgi:hypothetical protein